MATSRRRILIVEDSATMRQLLAFALRRLPNVELIEARDGVDGLKKLMGDHFDLVLVDINMPVLDGLRLIQLIREEPGHSGLRIVVITTEGASADRERAMALGADAYLTKPVQAGEVLSIVKGLLGE
jgi:two-component system, chemotaxis family, chemotaxis protein CheY